MDGIKKKNIIKYKNGYILLFNDKSAKIFANFIGISLNSGLQ